MTEKKPTQVQDAVQPPRKGAESDAQILTDNELDGVTGGSSIGNAVRSVVKTVGPVVDLK